GVDTAFATYTPMMPRSRPSPTSVLNVPKRGKLRLEYWMVSDGCPTSQPRPASTNATAVGSTVNPMPRSRIARALRKSNSDEWISLRYSSWPSAILSHCAGLPGGGEPPLLHCDTSTVPGSYCRKSNPVTVPTPPTEKRRCNGSSSPCSHPPSTSRALIQVVGDNRL